MTIYKKIFILLFVERLRDDDDNDYVMIFQMLCGDERIPSLASKTSQNFFLNRACGIRGNFWKGTIKSVFKSIFLFLKLFVCIFVHVCVCVSIHTTRLKPSTVLILIKENQILRQEAFTFSTTCRWIQTES